MLNTPLAGREAGLLPVEDVRSVSTNEESGHRHSALESSPLVATVPLTIAAAATVAAWSHPVREFVRSFVQVLGSGLSNQSWLRPTA